VDEKHSIVGFDKENTMKPSLCNSLNSCICICASDCTSENVVRCLNLESQSNKPVRLSDEFEIISEDIVTNYVLFSEDGFLSIRPELG